jgi:hypothetical protein
MHRKQLRWCAAKRRNARAVQQRITRSDQGIISWYSRGIQQYELVQTASRYPTVQWIVDSVRYTVFIPFKAESNLHKFVLQDTVTDHYQFRQGTHADAWACQLLYRSLARCGIPRIKILWEKHLEIAERSQGFPPHTMPKKYVQRANNYRS